MSTPTPDTKELEATEDTGTAKSEATPAATNEDVKETTSPAVPSEEPSSSTGATDAPGDVADQLANMTIFGNKSLEELHRIQERASHLSAGILFTDPSLMIPRPILEALTEDMRFEKPSQIQATTLPLILTGKNVIAQAQSGAGKTIAFVVGMLAKLQLEVPAPQALCMTPTRELAQQIVTHAVQPLSARMRGVVFETALPGRTVERGALCTSHIVVGTPGTMRKFVTMGYVPLNRVSIFVLDEADHMVNDKTLGADTLQVRNKLDPRCQILMFSATYTPEIIDYAKKVNPHAYVVTPRSREELVLDVIFQVKMQVPRGGKLQVLKDIYDFMTMQQSIVFVETRNGADAVARMMREGGFEVSVLHGDLEGIERDRVMAEFRAGRTKVLITTNALARGVDVPAVAVVVNYDLPITRDGARIVAAEATYLHRIGRCGRFGRRGTAISFLETPDDVRLLQQIEHYFLGGAGGARGGTRGMITAWDCSDISGLTQAIADRPEGGEILPEALDGNSSSQGQGSTSADASVSVSLLA